jgi:uncharacterized membrane protein YjgN (DUF898 family)
MSLIGVKCGKCGLIQMAKENCKSCGSPLMDPLNPGAMRSKPTVQRETLTASGEETQREALSAGREETQREALPAVRVETHRLTFLGRGGSLFGIYILNVFLTLVTFGFYSFWGRVKVRSFLMSQTQFDGDRLAYHGSGKELLLGFLKALVVFGIPIAVLTAVRDFLDVGQLIKVSAGLVAYLLILFLVPFATVAARRYRMSRTSWRGIRFSFRGRVWDFFKIFVGGSLLSTITLSLYYPFYATKKYLFMTSHSYFGDKKFQFNGSGRDLFGSFLLALVLTIPTLGLYWFWFSAKKQRLFFNHTSFGTSRLESSVTGGALLRLKIGNLLLLIVTLGLGWAWVVARNVNFAYRYITVNGPLDMDRIVQQAELAPATGEELAGFFDLDAGFDIG